MELFALVLSVPTAFVASAIYCLFATKLVAVWPIFRSTFVAISAVVLGVLGLELVLLITAGAVRGREVVGPSFYPIHAALFVLGVPALTNILVLRPRPGMVGRWYVAASVCAVFALPLVLMQYEVTASLYGPDGTGGPFGPQF
jgi:hypothetical protein